MERLSQRDELFLSVRAENEALEKEGAQLAEQLNDMNLTLAATHETRIALEEEEIALTKKLDEARLTAVA